MNKKLYGFYGSLRQEGYNFARVVEPRGDYKYLGEFTANGFKMADLGAYPMLFVSDTNDNKVLFEVFEINNPDTQRFIDMMETGAGYQEKQVESPYGPVTVYVGDVRWASSGGRYVESGDWIGFCKENKRRY